MNYKLESINTEVTTTLTFKKEPQFPTEFAVMIDDVIGLYTSALLGKIKKEVTTFHNDAVSKIAVGDFLLFNKKGVELEKNGLKVVLSGMPVLKLVRNFETVVATVDNFFENVYVKPKASPCDNCPIKAICGLIKAIKEVQEEEPVTYMDGERIDELNKVQIFSNYVKVGYGQYPIRNILGHSVIKSDSGDLFEVKQQSWFGGKKYLELVK